MAMNSLTFEMGNGNKDIPDSMTFCFFKHNHKLEDLSNYQKS